MSHSSVLRAAGMSLLGLQVWVLVRSAPSHISFLEAWLSRTGLLCSDVVQETGRWSKQAGIFQIVTMSHVLISHQAKLSQIMVSLDATAKLWICNWCRRMKHWVNASISHSWSSLSHMWNALTLTPRPPKLSSNLASCSKVWKLCYYWNLKTICEQYFVFLFGVQTWSKICTRSQKY